MVAPAKAILEIEGGTKIECMFNPAELTISKSNTWNPVEAKGKNAPELRFSAGQSATLTLSLTFDTTRQKDTPVTTYTDQLLGLMKVDKNLPGADASKNKGRPPWVQFQWGKTQSFKAIVERLQIRFTYFAGSGMPLRAKADVSLKQWHDDELLPLQNPTSSTPSLHTVHQLRPGETLDRVAAAHYGDPTRWRLIAEANDILDPLKLPAGANLAVPEQGVRHRNGNGGRHG